MSNFCPDCGKELRENSKFCANCGKEVVVKKLLKTSRLCAPLDVSKATTKAEKIKAILKLIDIKACLEIEIYDNQSIRIVKSDLIIGENLKLPITINLKLQMKKKKLL